MYLIEKTLHQACLTEEGQDTLNDPEYKDDESELIRETGRNSKGEQCWHPGDSASNTPRAPACMYAQNDRFLDFRTASYEKRGPITMAAAVFAPTALIAVSLMWFIFKIFFVKEGLLFAIGGAACTAAALWGIIKYY